MIENMQKSHIESVVIIHIEAFPDSFLTQLGKQVLALLYEEFTRKGFGYICQDEDEVVGFLAGIYTYSDTFYKDMVKAHLIRLPLLLGLSVIRKPSILMPILYRGNRLVRKERSVTTFSDSEYDSLSQAEGVIATALTMAVSQSHRGKGLAKQLWAHLLHDLPNQGVEAIIGSVQSDNEITNKFYEKMGFRIVSRVQRNYVNEEFKWLFYRRGHCSVSETGHVTWYQ